MNYNQIVNYKRQIYQWQINALAIINANLMNNRKRKSIAALSVILACEEELKKKKRGFGFHHYVKLDLFMDFMLRFFQ